MNTKRIFALVSAFTIAFAGVPAHVVFAEEAPSVDEAVVVEETVEEAAEEVVTDEVVAPVVDETVETEEETVADDKVLVEDETKVTEDVVAEDEEAESEVLTEDEEAEIEAELEEELAESLEEEELEEEHEHDIIYVPAGNHQHKVMCAVGGDDCDFEEEIADCVDEDEDGYCDLCFDRMEGEEQMYSKIQIDEYRKTLMPDENGELIYDYSISNSCSSSFGDKVSTADAILNITTYTSVGQGINDFADKLLASADLTETCPQDLIVSCYYDENDNLSDLVVKYTIVDDEKTVIFTTDKELVDDEVVNEEDIADIELTDAAETEDTEDKEAEELTDDTEIVAKEDEILPEDVVVDEAETVEPIEQTEELVEEIVVDEAPVDETPAANDSAAEETVTDSVVDGE